MSRSADRRKPAALLLLLLAACASPTAVIDTRSFRCGPGQDIEVRAGLDDGTALREVARELTYLVEVANNSHRDLTVRSVRVAPSGEESATGLAAVSKVFDQLIPEGEDHVFEIPASASWNPTSAFDRRIRGERLELAVTVALTNGDSYRCSFVSEPRR